MLRHDFARPDAGPALAPSSEALAFAASVPRHGLALSEVRDASARRGLLCILHRGSVWLTVDRNGNAVVVKGGAR